METTQNTVELNLVNRKKRRRGSRKKKSNAQQNSGQVQEQPEEGCLTGTNDMNITPTPILSNERNSGEKVLSLATDETNSFSLTNALPHLSHDNCKVLINANSFSMTKSEVQDTVLGVDSTICPSFPRIEQNGMETSQNLVEVNLVTRKKRRRGNRKKKTKTPQNSGQAQELPEQGCLTSTNDMNIMPTPILSNERNSEEKVVLLGTDEINSFSVTNSSQSLSLDTYKVFTNASSSSMARSEEQGTILGVDLPLCLPFARSEQTGMETIQNPVVVNRVSQKKSRKRQKKKTKALHNNEQAEKLPEDGRVTSTNHMNIMSMPLLSDERNTEEKVTFWGTGENSFSVNNSSLCLSHESSKVVSNTDSIPMTKSEMQHTNLGVDSTMCPPFATIEQMGMETAKNPVEVNMVMKKKTRRRSRKKKSNTVVNIHQVPEEGSLTGADCVNTMSTPCLLNVKNSKDKVVLSGAAESKQVCLAVANEEDNTSKVSHISLVRAHVGHSKKKLLILDINGLLADIIRPPPKKYKSDINIAGRAIFKRPFCLDFLKFCFERFEVGVWSSRSKKILERVIDYLMGDMKHKLLLCWDLSHCTATKCKTLEDKHKPIVFKELRKIWEKHDPSLPWEKGCYNESNTLLLDDSPYKALLNPKMYGAPQYK
ncbi:uncharacterized protein LOC132182837 isoform X2 [Corylus avellana]|uniref:uncharacterized protein LOC132182837 isoform X2 n=1 Tax=Corylus avellana TaxID=13451 RepID=UPI00286C9015|nr:uncharacterized protein LOC132182837 isoform X2 [Corylus avellana]